MARTKPQKARKDTTAVEYSGNTSLISPTNNQPLQQNANNDSEMIYICGSNGCDFQDIRLSGNPILEYYSDSDESI